MHASHLIDLNINKYPCFDCKQNVVRRNRTNTACFRGPITPGAAEAEALVSGEPHALMSLLPWRTLCWFSALLVMWRFDCHMRVSLYLALEPHAI